MDREIVLKTCLYALYIYITLLSFVHRFSGGLRPQRPSKSAHWLFGRKKDLLRRSIEEDVWDTKTKVYNIWSERPDSLFLLRKTCGKKPAQVWKWSHVMKDMFSFISGFGWRISLLSTSNLDSRHQTVHSTSWQCPGVISFWNVVVHDIWWLSFPYVFDSTAFLFSSHCLKWLVKPQISETSVSSLTNRANFGRQLALFLRWSRLLQPNDYWVALAWKECCGVLQRKQLRT